MAEDLTGALDAVVRQIIDGVFADDKSIPPSKPRGPFPAAKSVGVDTPATTPTTGNGVAWPLTETSWSSREFYPPSASYTSTDGLQVWEFSAPKKLIFTDANGGTCPFNFASPP